MNYTANEIDNMSMEDIEQLAEMLRDDELEEWYSNGYSGESYVQLMKHRALPQSKLETV